MRKYEIRAYSPDKGENPLQIAIGTSDHASTRGYWIYLRKRFFWIINNFFLEFFLGLQEFYRSEYDIGLEMREK